MNVKRTIGGGRGSREKIPKLESTPVEEPSSYTNKPVLDSHLNLLISGRFSDVTFIVGECKERIPSHQLFLKARSPVFEVMFSERWNQDSTKEVTLEDVDPETFKKFLLFIYADTLVTEDAFETLELLQLAHKYDLRQLVTKCETLLGREFNLDSALYVFQAARIYGTKMLMDRLGYLLAMSLNNLQVHPSFNHLDKETLIYILKRDDLEMKEVDLFRFALQWAKNQPDATVVESLQDILPLIRFPTMTPHEFATTVIPTQVLPESTIVQLFTYFRTDDKAKRRLLERTLGFSTGRRQPNDCDSIRRRFLDRTLGLSTRRWQMYDSDSIDSSSSSDTRSPRLVCRFK